MDPDVRSKFLRTVPLQRTTTVGNPPPPVIPGGCFSSPDQPPAWVTPTFRSDWFGHSCSHSHCRQAQFYIPHSPHCERTSWMFLPLTPLLAPPSTLLARVLTGSPSLALMVGSTLLFSCLTSHHIFRLPHLPFPNCHHPHTYPPPGSSTCNLPPRVSSSPLPPVLRWNCHRAPWWRCPRRCRRFL